MLTSARISGVIAAGYPAVGNTDVPVSDPPSMSEERARIVIVELLWIMYAEDPDSIGPPGTQPRDVWDMMLGDTHADMIAAAVAIMWP